MLHDLEIEEMIESELPHFRLLASDKGILCGFNSWGFVLASPFHDFAVSFVPVAVQKKKSKLASSTSTSQRHSQELSYEFHWPGSH